jgi:sensor histidine kinase regulating citrate/malate metabolism
VRVRISLKVKFLLLLSVVLLVGGSILFYLVDRQISSFVLEGAKNDFSSQINTRAQEYFDLASPSSLKLTGKYSDFAKALEKGLNTSNVKVLDSNGIIIYSNNPTDIGLSLIDSANIKEALTGDASLTNISKEDNSAEAYSPIKSQTNEVRGIVTAKIALSNVYSLLGSLRYQLLISVIVVSLIFLLASYIIFSNADKEMTEQGRTVLDKSKALEEEQPLSLSR